MGEISSVTWLYLVLIQFVQILFNLNLNKLNQNQVQDEISPVRKSNFGGRDYDVWKEMTFWIILCERMSKTEFKILLPRDENISLYFAHFFARKTEKEECTDTGRSYTHHWCKQHYNFHSLSDLQQNKGIIAMHRQHWEHYNSLLGDIDI